MVVKVLVIKYEPCHEIMALFILRKFVLQTRMRSYPVGLDARFFIGPFVYFHTSCVRTAKALARLRRCAGSPKPSLVTYVISTIISWAGSYILLFLGLYHHSSEIAYCKFPKYSDTQKICCNHSKIWTMWLYHRVMSLNDTDRMANSVDPDQTAPLGAVWSGSALFAQAYLSESLGSLQ